jgi:undecaprenyl-diphosphatase
MLLARKADAATPRPKAPLRLPRGSQPLVLLFCGSALLLFGYLTREMTEGETGRLDAAILIALRTAGNLAVPKGPAWLPQSAVDISALGGFTVLWLLAGAAVAYLLLKRKPVDAVIVAGSLGGASLLNTGLKLLVHRGRPEVVPHLVQVANASYPSGHAMLSATAYLTIAALLAHGEPSRGARLFILGLAAVLVVLIGVSRLYLGVHWPSDVLGGWCLGSAWALAIWTGSQRFRGDTARPEA